MYPEDRAVLLADAQALADVRTLDAFARRVTAADVVPGDHIFWKVRPGRGKHDPSFICQAIRGSNQYVYADLGEGGETEDAARRAAAEWVRKEQGK